MENQVPQIIIDMAKAGVRWAMVGTASWLVKYQLLEASSQQDFTSQVTNWVIILCLAAITLGWKYASTRWKWLSIFTALSMGRGSSLSQLKEEVKNK